VKRPEKLQRTGFLIKTPVDNDNNKNNNGYDRKRASGGTTTGRGGSNSATGPQTTDRSVGKVKTNRRRPRPPPPRDWVPPREYRRVTRVLRSND